MQRTTQTLMPCLTCHPSPPHKVLLRPLHAAHMHACLGMQSFLQHMLIELASHCLFFARARR